MFSIAFYRYRVLLFPRFFSGYISFRFSRPFHRGIDCFVLLVALVVSHVLVTSLSCLKIRLIPINGREQRTSAKWAAKKERNNKTTRTEREFEFATRYFDTYMVTETNVKVKKASCFTKTSFCVSEPKNNLLYRIQDSTFLRDTVGNPENAS